MYRDLTEDEFEAAATRFLDAVSNDEEHAENTAGEKLAGAIQSVIDERAAGDEEA